MTDETDAARWERIKSVFADALELQGREREELLEREAGEDHDLDREVRSLLAAGPRAGALMAAPTLGPDDWDRPPALVAASRPERLGRYRIRSLLGTGGMGEVYLAHDPLLDRQVALKVLPADLAEHPNRRARFLHEARAAASLNHPNITTIHEIGEADGRDFIAFEYVEGRTLRERIAGRPLELKALVDIAVPLADALAHAHERGLVHRDIKSANVMVTARGLPKLLDFGLAKLVHARGPREPGAESPADGADGIAARATEPAITLSGTISGTPEAMSPEQALGRSVDQRTDVFSFGSLLHEMACGRAAFRGLGPQETLQAVIHAEPASLHGQRPDLPEDFLAIVARALRKRPEERYQDFAHLAADLRQLQRATDTGLFAAAPVMPAGSGPGTPPSPGPPSPGPQARGPQAHAVPAPRPTVHARAGSALAAAGPISRAVSASATSTEPALPSAATPAPSAAPATRAGLAFVGCALLVALFAWWRDDRVGAPFAAAPVTGPALPASAPPSGAGSGTSAAASPFSGVAATGAPALPHLAAVMSFENVQDPGDKEQLADMLSRLLTTQLGSGSGVPMVSQQRLYEVARELGHEDGRVDRSIATAVAHGAGVDTMILGQVGRSGETLVATAEVVDVATGRTLGSHQARGTALADVFAMAAALGRQVRDTLREPAMSDVERRALDQQLTTSVEAFRAFIRGLEALQRNHPADAVVSLKEATAIDPAFALAQFRLAMALVWTGHFEETDTAIDRAAAFSERLPPNIQLLLKAAHAYFLEDNSRAGLPALQQVLAEDPRNADALYFISEIYTHSATQNDSHKAVQAFDQLLALDRGLSLLYEHHMLAYLRCGDNAAARAHLKAWETLRPDNLRDLQGTLALWENRLPEAAVLLRDRLPADVLADGMDDGGGGARPPAAVQAVLALTVPQVADSLKELSGLYLTVALDLRADVFVMHGRFAEAAELYRLAADVPGRVDLDGFMTSARNGSRQRLAFLLALQGDLAGARRELVITLQEQPDSFRCVYVAALLALRDGDEPAAQAALVTLTDLAGRGWSPSAEIYRDALAAELELARGQAAEARAHFAALVGSGRLMEDWYAHEDSIGPLLRDGLARACLQAGDQAGASAAWNDLLHCGLERLRHPVAWVSALHDRGVLELQSGDAGAGRVLLGRFVRCWGDDAADGAARALPQVLDARAKVRAPAPR